MRQTIGIFGNGRGGTSAVAGIVYLLGVHMEFASALSLDDQAFKLSFQNGTAPALIAERSASHSEWGFKHPYLLVYAGELQHMLKNPLFIFVSRDPIASECTSKATFDAADPDKLASADRRWVLLSTMIRGCSIPHIVVSYEKLTTKTAGVVEQIAQFIGSEVNDKAVSFVNSKLGYQDVERFS